MNKPFKFKQFVILQDKTAMKVGTDGVLLGAWVSLTSSPFSVLDIGTGTGLIALQLAQRSSAKLIDAIEIDDNAYEQAVENFENSPWSDRLFCYHASFQEFIQEIEDRYDLIVSNPPFYTESYKTENEQRALARFEDALPFEHLLEGVVKLLESEGVFSTIIPYKAHQDFISLASTFGLFPKHICHVKGHIDSVYKRSLLSFTFKKSDVQQEELIIEKGRHHYTDAYITLTQEFYLKL